MSENNVTYIKYEKLSEAAQKIKKVNKQIDLLKIDTKKISFDKKFKIPTIEDARNYCKEKLNWDIKIHPDVRYILGDKDFYWPMYWGNSYSKYIDSSVLMTPEEATLTDNTKVSVYSVNGEYTGPKVEYKIPSLEIAAEEYQNARFHGTLFRPLLSDDDDTRAINGIIKELEKAKKFYEKFGEIVNKYNKSIDVLYQGMFSEKIKITKIYDAYKNLEKSSKNKFKGNKTGKKYSKTEIAKKYAALVSAAGTKNAKKYLSRILKKTNSKVTSAEVLSIYKKYKNKKKISGNLNSKEEKDTKRTKTTARKTSSKSSSGATAAMAATGGTVAATKVKKTTKKATKTNSKKIKSSVKNGVLTTVPSLASLKAMKKQLQNNTTVKISNIKTEANNRIADIEGKAEDEKKLAEIEKNNTIKQINEDAASKINAIDPNDSEASTKIENIQTEAENAIKNADEKFENRVNEIETKKNQDVSQIENSRENDIKSVEEKSNKEIEEINGDIEKAKKTKSSKKSVQTTAKTSSKATETKAETKEYKSNVSDNDVETSGTAADDSSTKVDEAVSNKQDEITAAEQAKENTSSAVVDDSSSDSSANVAQPETTTSTPEQSTSTSVETDTSSNNTNYSTSGASTSSNYNNSYDADESYSAGDYNTIEQQKQADINSSNTGVDQSTLKSDSTTKSTFDIKKDTTSSTSSSTSSNKDIDDISSISSTKSTSSKKSSGLGAAVPIGLGIAATGAAAVAGVRYVKNKKLNEDYDENYDDENNDVYNDEVPSDSAYMADDYLGPEGSSYTEVPDDNEYTDAEALEEEAGVSDFSEDAALNELN